MKKFEYLEWNEQNEIANLFANWLKNYTHEVICKVLVNRDEIINNDFVMNLLKELAIREKAEAEEFSVSMRYPLKAFDNHKEFDPHNHALIHAGSYRDILYDMYIK